MILVDIIDLWGSIRRETTWADTHTGPVGGLSLMQLQLSLPSSFSGSR